MKCREIQKLISLLVDGELDLQKSKWVENHISNCLDCARYKSELLAIKKSFSTLPEPEISPYLFTRIKAQLYPEGRVNPVRRFAYITITAILIIFSAFLGNIIGKGIFNYSQSKIYEQAITTTITPFSDNPEYSLSYVVLSNESEGTNEK